MARRIRTPLQKPRGRNPEKKPIMEEVLKNTIPQAGTPSKGGSPAIDADRVKAPVVAEGSTDFGGSQMHSSASKTEVVGVDHSAPAAPSATSDEPAFQLLKKRLEALVESIQGKTTIHKEVVTMTTYTSNAFKEFENARHSRKLGQTTNTSKDGMSQTLPLFRVWNASQDPSKWMNRSPSETPSSKKVKQGTPPTGSRHNEEPSGDRNGAWKEVEKKKKKKREKEKKTKPLMHRIPPMLPSALMIRAKEGKSYADILRKIKKDVSNEVIDDSIDRVRRTNTGQLLIVLNRNSADRSVEWQKLMAGALREEADVVSKTQEIDLEIRDLEETTDKNEVVAALQKAAGDDHEVTVESVKSLRKAYGETQIAIVRLSVVAARKVIGKEGKIRVGWVRCRIREVKRPIKCFKCWHYGHLSSKCKSEVDRSKRCIKCGEDGHKIADCRKDAHCVLCAKKGGGKECSHSAGSNRCAVIKEALQAMAINRRK